MNNFWGKVVLGCYISITLVVNATAAPTQIIHVGVVAPFSGRYADYGKQLLYAIQTAINDQNLTNLTIEVIPFDDKGSSANSIAIAHKIVKDHKVNIIIEHTFSANNVIANKIYARAGILQLIPTAINPSITKAGVTTIFKICGNAELQAQTISNFIGKNFSHKNIAIMHTSNPDHASLALFLQEYLGLFNITPVLYQSMQAKQFDNYFKIKNIIKKLQNMQVEILFFAGFYKETAELIKSLHYHNMKIPVIATADVATPGFNQVLKYSEIAAGTIVTLPKMKFQAAVQGQPLLGYVAMQVIIKALINLIEANADLNSTNLAKWLHQNKVETILGVKFWDTNGDIVNSEFNLYMLDQHGNYISEF